MSQVPLHLKICEYHIEQLRECVNIFKERGKENINEDREADDCVDATDESNDGKYEGDDDSVKSVGDEGDHKTPGGRKSRKNSATDSDESREERREIRSKHRNDAHNIGFKVTTPAVPHTENTCSQLTIYVGPVSATNVPVNNARYIFKFESQY